MIRAMTLLTAVLVAAGCHHYVPTPGPVAPGTRVRVHLTMAGAIRVSEARGEPKRRIEGTVVRTERDTLALAVPRLGIEARLVRSGFPTADIVLISPSDVEAMDEERISGKRTALLAGGIGVLVAVVARQATRKGGGSQGSGKPGNPLKGLLSVLLRFLGSPGGGRVRPGR